MRKLSFVLLCLACSVSLPAQTRVDRERPTLFPKLSCAWKDAKPIFYDGEWHADMCLVQDKRGRWHCIGISQPDCSLFHAVCDKLDGRYEYLPRIGTDDPLIKFMWAPHVIWKDDNTAYLYYFHFSKVSQGMRLLISHDQKLERWEPYSGSAVKGNLLFEEVGDRDPCVFYDSSEKCYLMYYASTGPIKVRKSQDMVRWSDSIIVVGTPPKPYGVGESPQVIKRGDWYYLFVSGVDYGRVSVYASKDPYGFGDATQDRLYEISGHAPEIIHIDGTDYIACVGISSTLGGLPGESDLNDVYIQKLEWVGWNEATAAALQIRP